jgi:hypothetical protein
MEENSSLDVSFVIDLNDSSCLEIQILRFPRNIINIRMTMNAQKTAMSAAIQDVRKNTKITITS